MEGLEIEKERAWHDYIEMIEFKTGGLKQLRSTELSKMEGKSSKKKLKAVRQSQFKAIPSSAESKEG